VPNVLQVQEIWDSILMRLKEAGVAVRVAPTENPLAMEGIECIIDALSYGPLKRYQKSRNQWISGVGIVDCLHIMAARSLGATQFLTTDRCLSEMEVGINMILVSDDSATRERIEEGPALKTPHHGDFVVLADVH
jgi:hypothetical protein